LDPGPDQGRKIDPVLHPIDTQQAVTGDGVEARPGAPVQIQLQLGAPRMLALVARELEEVEVDLVGVIVLGAVDAGDPQPQVLAEAIRIAQGAVQGVELEAGALVEGAPFPNQS
jgi:hypothetical protein